MQDNAAALKELVSRKQNEGLKVLYADVEAAARRHARKHGLDLVLHYNDFTDEPERTGPQNILRKMQAGATMPLYAAPGIDISKELVTTLNDALRKRKGGDREDEETAPLESRSFMIPVRTAPGRRGDVKQLRVFVSRDKGKTWRRAATLGPDKTQFRFDAPADGHYWFKVQVVDREGKLNPRELADAPVARKVLVRADAKPETAEEPSEVEQLRAALSDLEKRVAQAERTEKRNKEVKQVRADLEELARRVKELEKERKP